MIEAILRYKAIWLACFTLGMLLGAIITVVLIGSKVDELYYENRELELQLESTAGELAEVKAALSKSKGLVVTKIISEIIMPPERFTSQEADKIELALNKEIIKHYKSLVGVPIKSLEPVLLPKIIDGRIMEIEGKRFKLFVKTLVLSETLYLEVEIEQIANI